jgi:hypothetical protein
MCPLGKIEMSPFGLSDSSLLRRQQSSRTEHGLKGATNDEYQGARALIPNRKSN